MNKEEAIRKHLCVKCKNEATTFRGEIFGKRYLQLGLCQQCQDTKLSASYQKRQNSWLESRKKHRAARIANTRSWCKRNPDYPSQYIKSHKKEQRGYAKTYYQKHQKEILAKYHLTRLNLLLPNQTFKLYLYKLQEGRCAYCNKVLVLGKISTDHMVPRIRGGPSISSNIVIVCPSCSSSKRDKTVEEYIKWLKEHKEEEIASKVQARITEVLRLKQKSK